MIALTIACAVACGILVVGEYLESDRIRYLAKPLASVAFVLVGALAFRCNPTEEWGLAVLVGLILGAIGDVALLGAHGFLAGLGSFLLGHLAYVVAVGTRMPPHYWLGSAGLFALFPIVLGLAALTYLWPKLGKLRVPVIVYVAVIIAMVVAAIAFWRGNDASLQCRELFGLGAVLFFISDLAVARDKFVAKGFSNRVWGLPVYYAAQLLIAWSLAR